MFFSFKKYIMIWQGHSDLEYKILCSFTWNLLRAVPGKKVLGGGTELENGGTTNTILSFYGTESIWIFLETPPTHIILIDFSSTPPRCPFSWNSPNLRYPIIGVLVCHDPKMIRIYFGVRRSRSMSVTWSIYSLLMWSLWSFRTPLKSYIIDGHDWLIIPIDGRRTLQAIKLQHAEL